MTTTADLDVGRNAKPMEASAPAATSASLASAFRRWSPRLNPKPANAAGVALYSAVVALLLAGLLRAVDGDGIWAWSVGVVYIAYDFALLAFVAWQARALFWRDAEPPAARRRPTVGVIVAAYNEGPALAATLDALLRQSDPPDEVCLADDGSEDGGPSVLAERYGLRIPPSGVLGAPSPVAPSLRWLRLPHRGKAHALNAALAHATSDVVLTVDADTLLEPDAIAVVRRAFAADERLVVGGGVLRPRCARGGSGASSRPSRPMNMCATSSAATPGRAARASC